jgi:hypothetical protein
MNQKLNGMSRKEVIEKIVSVTTIGTIGPGQTPAISVHFAVDYLSGHDEVLWPVCLDWVIDNLALAGEPVHLVWDFEYAKHPAAKMTPELMTLFFGDDVIQTAEEWADKCHLSLTKLYYKIRKDYAGSLTPKQLVNQAKLNRIKEELEFDPSISQTNMGYALGLGGRSKLWWFLNKKLGASYQALRDDPDSVVVIPEMDYSKYNIWRAHAGLEDQE